MGRPRRNSAIDRSGQRLQTLCLLVGGAIALASCPIQASAETGVGGMLGQLPFFDTRSAIGSSVLLGIIIFSTTLAIMYVKERQRWQDGERANELELARLRGADDRAGFLLGSERQVVIVWNGADPVVEGDPSLVGEGANYRRVLAFGSWLAAADAGRFEAALAVLRERGEAFRMTLETASGSYVEGEGRTIVGRAVLRLRDVSDDRAARLSAETDALRARDELARLRALLDAVEEPAWLRNEAGGLEWANRAYCAAVEAGSVDVATARSLELLDRKEREAAARRCADGEIFRARVAAIMAGSRRVLDITEAPLSGLSGPGGVSGRVRTGGLARDVSDLEALRAEIASQTQAHVRMLDQLPIAVAMFDSGQRLVFHNSAYRQLWSLDAAFLEGHPSDGEILDRLRAARRLPEQADFWSWKASVLETYRSLESTETWWHLPDRRTLRVVANPSPQGGLTYLFDDVSDRMDLESRVNALIQVQRETLDTLAEGVALFGQDGRLKLFNRAFANLWRLDQAMLDGSPHIQAMVEHGTRLAPVEGPWSDLVSAVSGLSDRRERSGVRMERLDGSVLDCAAEPLPDGATLLTFVDVTASVNVERALTERNEALELAGRLRNEFVHHVSYELRSPLTNIIGFAELLGAETVGPLNERQREYTGHITRSSGSLLAIINDILDLASIDTETIELAHERVDILQTIEAAALGIQDRLDETKLRLQIDVPAGIGSFSGDAKRVRQILYNLMSNAAGFSSPGQTIRVSARKEQDEVIIAVTDEGRGIPQDVRDRVFDRFESHTAGSSHRGVGLGLSIVRSFVELHGGRVELVSERGAGTTVTCRFPADGRPSQQLAASIPPDEEP
ncbi:PAS-domain containing protein [uncultured Enterovirga sp.]|uniref:PAS domain-containing sensor histidine kinase n=1 Tax=uncultured Enterovirga sp. TaxID=2026352 RepID=UPI0035CBF040